MKIPIKITPCPITEAIVEIKFDSDVDPDAIYGIIYNVLHNKYPNTHKLPILQLPEAVRLRDPNLIFQPHYKLSNGSYLFQVGPKVVTLNNIKEYVGWKTFYAELMETFSLIKSLKIIKNVKRLGIRYINFFKEFNILDNINLTINLKDIIFKDINTFFRAEIPTGEFKSILQIGNQMTIDTKNQKSNGSIIDIDIFIEKDFGDFFENISDYLNKGHDEEKKLFFSLLSDDFLQTLNPEY